MGLQIGLVRDHVTCSKLTTKPRFAQRFLKPLLPSCCFYVGIPLIIAALGSTPL